MLDGTPRGMRADGAFCNAVIASAAPGHIAAAVESAFMLPLRDVPVLHAQLVTLEVSAELQPRMLAYESECKSSAYIPT